MSTKKISFRSVIEHGLPWLVLVVLLFYTYAKFFVHPYGFRWLSDGTIARVFVEQSQPTLMEGDRLVRVGVVPWEDFQNDLRKTFFTGVKPGDVVPVVVERDGQILSISWTYPWFNRGDFIDQFFSEWWLVYFFWLAGTLTLLLLRPRDERWLLMTAFNFLTAIWLIAGSGNSSFHSWYSALILRMAIWLCVPVYLHLHWIFPRPLTKLPPLLIGTFYGLGLVLFIAQGFQALPQNLYFLGFVTAVLGSLVLLFLHAFREPESRRALRLLFVVLFLALIPSIAIGVAGAIRPLPNGIASLALLSFPLFPLTYFFVAYRRQLGKTELRVNRFISIYLFTILLGAVGMPLIVLTDLRMSSVDSSLVIGIAASITTGAACLWGYPAFQKFVERRWLGISLPPDQIQESYSARITTSTSLTGLIQLLEGEVLPSLFVRQFAFLKLDSGFPIVLLAEGVTDEQALSNFAYSELMEQSGNYRPAQLLNDKQPCPWAHLILPLKVGETVIGFWLFGRRDPDDIYAQAEIPVLQSLANQTAIALSNILQTERLRAMYQANVDRYEEERLRLALDLHDSILNQLAVLQMNLDKPSQKFQDAYEGLTQRLREIVSNLRPPMLNYGLEPAVHELADNLMERSEDTVQVKVDLQTDGTRYPPKIELHLFRIVQEACENALRHAQAKDIKISGTLSAQEVDLTLEDDGLGFEAGENLQLDALLENKHFGLAGMIERAVLIEAEVRIESRPEKGTSIRITWEPGQV